MINIIGKISFRSGLDVIYIFAVYCKNVNCKVFIYNFNRFVKLLSGVCRD